MQHRDELKMLIEQQLATKTTSEWEALLIPAGTPTLTLTLAL
jgi:crotonobetainyl-CoA:carnitine CoA-transferase CaiB-like acyl-CoA transferase